MPIKLFSVDQPPKAVGIAIYAQTGVGKTTLLGTMPGRGLVIDVPQVEGGAYVLADKADKIDGVLCEDWEDIDEIYWALSKKDKDVLPNVEEYRWVAVDSITGMQEMSKRKIINERDRNLGDDPHYLTLRERGGMGELVGELIYRFRKLPLSSIWIAQERIHGGGDNDPNPIITGPDVQRGILSALKPSMAIMGRLELTLDERGRERRNLRVGPAGSEDYILKAKGLPGRKCPNLIREPDLGVMLRYLFGSGPKPKAAREDSIF